MSICPDHGWERSIVPLGECPPRHDLVGRIVGYHEPVTFCDGSEGMLTIWGRVWHIALGGYWVWRLYEDSAVWVSPEPGVIHTVLSERLSQSFKTGGDGGRT